MNKILIALTCLLVYSNIQAKQVEESRFTPVFLKDLSGDFFNVSNTKKAWVFDNRNGVYFIYFETTHGNNMYYKPYYSHLDAEMDMQRLLKVIR